MWKTYSGLKINDFQKKVEQIINNSTKNLKIIVGTDSQVIGTRISFVTAVVFWNVGFGGNILYNKVYVPHQNKLKIMQNRLFEQAVKAVQVAKEVQKILKKFQLKVDEIHLDLNANKKYLSNRIAASCIGYVKWNGFKAVIKPDSFAASDVADDLTR